MFLKEFLLCIDLHNTMACKIPLIFYTISWLCAWKKDINAFVILPGAYIWRFDTYMYFSLSPMYHLYCFICQNFTASKILSSDYHILQFYLQCK